MKGFMRNGKKERDEDKDIEVEGRKQRRKKAKLWNQMKSQEKNHITTEEEQRCFEIVRTLLADAGRVCIWLSNKDTTAYLGYIIKTFLTG